MNNRHRVSIVSSRTGHSSCGAFLFVCVGVCAGLDAQTAKFLPLPKPPAPYTSFAGFLSATNDGVGVGAVRLSQDYFACTWSESEGYIFLPSLVPGGISTASHFRGTADAIPGNAWDGQRMVPVLWTDRDKVTALFEPPAPYDHAWIDDASDDLSVFAGFVTAGSVSFPNAFVPAIYEIGNANPLLPTLPLGGTNGGFGGMSGLGETAAGAIGGSFGQVAVTWTKPQGIVSRGDLPGSSLDAGFADMSFDGRVAVGFGNQGIRHAVRWTEAHGMVDLGTHVGPSGFSQAWGISGDGWTVVGESAQPFIGDRAMIWNPIDGLRLLLDVLQDEHGLDLNGWILGKCNAVSDDGRYIAGIAGSPEKQTVGFLVEMPPFCYADCDRGTGKGTLDVFDFLCYMSHFDQQDVYSNCNNDGAVDFFDFLCFINKWHEGCP